METKLRECHRVLKETGSIYLHCDWHATAHLRILMDSIFGQSNFRNEIIWKRTNHPKGSQFKDRKYGVYTDSILFYTKSNTYTFELERIRKPLTEEELKIKYPKIDERGRYLVYPIIRSESKGERPNLVYDYKGFVPKKWGWVVNKKKLIEIDKRGDLGWTKEGTPFRKYRITEDRGQPIGNLWDDIDRVGQGENLGYPTQKPVELLERIIQVSSNQGDVVLDPFCGCGTTLAAAQRLNRRWIGIDVSPTACKLIVKRLRQQFAIKAQLIKGDVDLKYVRKLEPFEFQNWVIVDKFLGTISKTKSGDFGIDGLTPQITGGYPVQVKQSEDIGRNVVDNFQSAMRRVKKNKGYIIAFSFGSGAREEAARLKNHEGITIILRTVQELLDGKIEE